MNEEDKVNRNKTRNHSNVIKITGLDSSRNNSNGSNPNVRKNNSISPQALSTRGKVNTKKFGEQEMILKSIEDWNILESKLRNEPEKKNVVETIRYLKQKQLVNLFFKPHYDFNRV